MRTNSREFGFQKHQKLTTEDIEEERVHRGNSDRADNRKIKTKQIVFER